MRNQNTRAPVGLDPRIEVAQQSVLHDAQHQSALELPVAPVRAP
ncbi:MAG TPA: hypothetical protein VFR85_09025 [Anaeromyxobacteraceae bacterium]|nr:hypothetical protein [Anaeromyxobacteraceae bacterium]